MPKKHRPTTKPCAYCEKPSARGICDACVEEMTREPEWMHEGLEPPRFRVEVCSDNHDLPRGARLVVEEVKAGDQLDYGEALCVRVDEIVCVFGRLRRRAGEVVVLGNSKGIEEWDFNRAGDTRLCRIFSVTLPGGETVDPNRYIQRGTAAAPIETPAQVVSLVEWKARRNI